MAPMRQTSSAYMTIVFCRWSFGWDAGMADWKRNAEPADLEHEERSVDGSPHLVDK